MKRPLLAFTAALMLAVSLASCSNKTPNDNNNNNNSGTNGSGSGYDNSGTAAAGRSRSGMGYNGDAYANGEYYADGEGGVYDWGAGTTAGYNGTGYNGTGYYGGTAAGNDLVNGARTVTGDVENGLSDMGDAARGMVNDLKR